jgi:ubiquinone/menaquinone biosynthesis C-methylase UbiE
MPDTSDIEAGQAVYTPAVLRIYDGLVLGLSNHLIWRCPTSALRQLYDRNVSGEHLDIGVGTGYFLDKATWPVANPSITLVDLNRNCLNAASARIRRFRPETVVANALEPLPLRKSFGSAGLCYLLHCMPGAIPEKAAVFDHIRPLMNPGGRVFGATVVQGAVPRTLPVQALMNLYNRKGLFSNAGDAVEDLDSALRARFSDVEVEVKGNVALFQATAG